MKRKIIGIGETIMDIIFRNGQPQAAVPGGSVFNGIISLGRLGQNVTIFSETGNDRVGQTILDFMQANGVDNHHVAVYKNGRSAISLAWLNDRNDAEYTFYKDYPAARLEVELPPVNADDVVMMSSYFVLNPVLRPKVKEFLDHVRSNDAIIYYDLNFRSSHKHEVNDIYAAMLENLQYSDIVRASREDLDNLFGNDDADFMYDSEISKYCKVFISTDADGDIRLITPNFRKSYAVSRIQTVSTIGAGDNFNAGIIYGLMQYGICCSDILSINEEKWGKVIQCGQDLASEVCQSIENSISKEFAEKYRRSFEEKK